MGTVDALRCWLGERRSEQLKWYDVIAKIQQFEQEEKEAIKRRTEKFGSDLMCVTKDNREILNETMVTLDEMFENRDVNILSDYKRDTPLSSFSLSGLFDEIWYRIQHKNIVHSTGGDGQD